MNERLAKGPVGVGISTLKDWKVFWLKPSRASQKAFEKTPLFLSSASWTSSLPKVFLSIRKDKEPSGRMQAWSASLQ
jgi:hypothetical protein